MKMTYFFTNDFQDKDKVDQKLPFFFIFLEITVGGSAHKLLFIKMITFI